MTSLQGAGTDGPPPRPSICSDSSQFDGEACITSESTFDDYINDGCTINGLLPGPPRFGTIDSGVPVCGQISAFAAVNPGEFNGRDQDSYRFTVSSVLQPGFKVSTSSPPIRFTIFVANPDICDSRSSIFTTLIEDSTTTIFPGTLQPGDYNVEVVLETNRVEVGCDEVEYEVLLDYSLSAAPSNQPSESSEPSMSIQPTSTTNMPTATTELPTTIMPTTTTYMPTVSELNVLSSLSFESLIIFISF